MELGRMKRTTFSKMLLISNNNRIIHNLINLTISYLMEHININHNLYEIICFKLDLSMSVKVRRIALDT